MAAGTAAQQNASRRLTWEAWGARILALVFIWAGIRKVLYLGEFAFDIQTFHAMPERTAHVLAYVIPSVELLAAVLLLLPWSRLPAFCFVAFLLSLFMGALASAWYRGLTIRCGCFSSTPVNGTAYLWLLGRNMVLLSLAAACCLRIARLRRHAHEKPLPSDHEAQPATNEPASQTCLPGGRT